MLRLIVFHREMPEERLLLLCVAYGTGLHVKLLINNIKNSIWEIHFFLNIHHQMQQDFNYFQTFTGGGVDVGPCTFFFVASSSAYNFYY